MILQQLPKSLIVNKILTEYYSNTGENLILENPNLSYKDFIFNKSKGMIYDIIGDSALLYNKININDLFDYEINITDFENPSGQLQSGTESINTILNKYDTTIKIVPNDLNNDSQFNATTSAINKFNTFIKITGLIALELNGVYLTEGDKILSIGMADSNPLFTGTLEIKTW